MTPSQRTITGEIAPLKEGYILDLATSTPVDGRKPEEKVRQEYEKILHEDYGFEYSQMDIEVFIQRGSKAKPKTPHDRADIVIYHTTDKEKRDQNSDVLGIVETKRPEKEEGVRQLMSYMSASSCMWGVWTNGNEIEYLYKDSKTGHIKREFIYQIPKNGETFETMGKIRKKDLIPAKNLTVIFRRILKTLYANTNISRREKLGNEMIRLIFCKIWDEKYNVDQPPKFKIGFDESPKTVKENVVKLFKEVKEELVDEGIIDKSEEITLDAESIAYVVGELEHFGLLKTDKDTVGDAFEVFAESKLVGEKGEFFTPRSVVKTCIEIVDPSPKDKICDPACGSGGFLIYAIEHVWNGMEKDSKYKGSPNLKQLKGEIAQRNIFGIDKEIDLVKIAKAYMAIVGDGKGGIVQQNTLHRPEKYEGKAKELFVNSDNTLKKFNIILTNPPFGAKIKVLKEESKNFNLGHVWKHENEKWIKTKKVKDTEPQVLFVERCFEMLEDGGILGIVLPETYFHAPSDKYVLEYIRKDNNIIAVIDLAHNTFRPYNNAKTILLIVQKKKKQNDKIIMAIAEQTGHDHNGNPIYRYDYEKKQFTDEIWDDTIIIRQELKNPSNPKNKNVFIVDVKEIKNDILVPRYYWKKTVKEINKMAEKQKLKMVLLKDLIDKKIIKHYTGHGSPPAKFKGMGNTPYIRVADIMNWDVYKNPVAMIPEEVYLEKKGKNGIDLNDNDILFVRRGSYRIGTVAMVSPYDKKVLLTKEISIFRIIDEKNKYDINPYYLIYLFSHELTQKQLNNKVLIETTLPNIANRWEELYLPISKNKKKRVEIITNMKKVFDKKWEAQKEIQNLRDKFGNLTT